MTAARIRIVDDLFDWDYAYFLESELFKRKVLRVAPQALGADIAAAGPITIHAPLPADWNRLSGGFPAPFDQPGDARLPAFSMQLAQTELAPCLEGRLRHAAVNYDVLGNVHPSPPRPGGFVMLLFLSSRWTEEHGGEVFFYRDDSRADIVLGSSPFFNRAIVFDGSIPYTVRPPTKAAVFPRMVATFAFESAPAIEVLWTEGASHG